MSTRLTNSLREECVKRALAHALDERKTALTMFADAGVEAYQPPVATLVR